MNRLVLFDIDGTLLWSSGAGKEAFLEAGQAVIGDELITDGVHFAGNLDSCIFAELCQVNAIANSLAIEPRFRAAYRAALSERLREPGRAYALRGVESLIEALRAQPDVVLGLLTGNYKETGEAKIRAAGLPLDWIEVETWGDDGRHRRDLPPVALLRFEERFGHAIAPGRVTVIGDTPLDIECARAHGCRSLAVATGIYEQAFLERCGADRVVANLESTSRLVKWILSAGDR